MSPAAILSEDEATQALLVTADQLFYQRGVERVTMADLRDASGVSMRRLYNLYPTKSDVVTAWLRDRHEHWFNDFTAGVGRRVAAGEDPLVAVFAYVQEWLVATDFRGCGFINTHAAAGQYNTEQRAVVQAHKRVVDRYLTELIPTVPGLAVLVDGAIVQASIYASVEPVEAALRLAESSNQR